MSKKEKNLMDFFVTNNINENELPKAKTWIFVGLPKRGKTYGASRFNPSMSVEKTIYIDLEHCTLEYPEYRGLNILPVTSYVAPLAKDENGNYIENPQSPGSYKKLTPKERSIFVGGNEVQTYSIVEVLAILKALEKSGQLKNFESIVIDTVDQLQAMVEEETINEYNEKSRTQVTSIGDIGEYGSGWDNARKKIVSVVRELKTLASRNNLELVLSVHSKTTTQLKGKTQRDPALRTGVGLTLFGEAAAIAYIDRVDTNKNDGDDYGTVKDGKQYTMSFVSNSEETTGGSRFSKLVNKTFPFSYGSLLDAYKEISTTQQQLNNITEVI